jgi:3'-phosphoadenosine 5'-phosphosulfate sulfotransferase (PAPS reductase)/FAD synthetase
MKADLPQLNLWETTAPINVQPAHPVVHTGDRFPISITPEIATMLAQNAPVAIGVSGGKDSSAVAIRLVAYLKEIGYAGEVVLIHSDLGCIEWKESLPQCERLAKRLGLELIVTRRPSGDLMVRWEQRWENCLTRYVDLSCVRLILPWSTPSMRFCTSELKTAQICSTLSKRFPKQPIISVTGIRHQESASRAKLPCSMIQPKLCRKDVTGYNWNPIITWNTPEVYEFLEMVNEPLHEAYTDFGLTRVSCCYCIMSSGPDLVAATQCEETHEVYRQIVALEATSTFAFQGSRWLGDVAPHLLPPELRQKLIIAKEAAKVRAEAEKLIPKHLLYVKGWPTAIPSPDDAELIAQVRRRVAAAMGIQVNCTKAESVRTRYAELMNLAAAKGGKGNVMNSDDFDLAA